MPDKSNATPAQVAIAYFLAKKPYIIPLFGTTNLAHLDENIQATALRFSPNELKKIDSTLDSLPIMGDRYPPEQAERVGK